MPARFLTSLAAAFLLALTLPSVAAAEWHFTPSVGTTFKADTSFIDLDRGTEKAHPNFGGTVTLLGSGIFGVEGLFVWTPGFFTNEQVALPGRIVKNSHVFAMMGNAVVTTPRNWTEYGLRPFLSGGFGTLGFSRTDFNNVLTDSGKIAAFNIGGGAIGFLSKRTGLRFDLRYYNNLRQAEEGGPIAIGRPHLRYMTLSAGVVIRR